MRLKNLLLAKLVDEGTLKNLDLRFIYANIKELNHINARYATRSSLRMEI